MAVKSRKSKKPQAAQKKKKPVRQQASQKSSKVPKLPRRDGRHDPIAFRKLEVQWAAQGRRKDYLLDIPSPGHRYVDDNGDILFDDRYVMKSQMKVFKPHPKIVEATKNGTLTPALERYYYAVPAHINYPITGVSKEPGALGFLPVDSSAVSSSPTSVQRRGAFMVHAFEAFAKLEWAVNNLTSWTGIFSFLLFYFSSFHRPSIS